MTESLMERAKRQLDAAAILNHPAYPDILLAYAERLLTIRRGERLLNQLLAQREREFLGFLLICQHYAHQAGGPAPTLTRLQQSGLGSPRRIASFVALLRLAGLVHSGPQLHDRRSQTLVPASQLLELHADWTRAAFRQLDRLLDAPLLEMRLAEPAFHQRACLIGAAEVFHGPAFAPGRFPLVDLLTPHRGGHLIAASLAQALCLAGATPTSQPTTIELPYGRIARRLGVSRSHVLNVVSKAAARDLLTSQAAGRHVILSAASQRDIFGYFAHELAFIGRHALRACDPTVALDLAWLNAPGGTLHVTG